MTFAEFFRFVDEDREKVAKCRTYKQFWKEQKRTITSVWSKGEVLYYPSAKNTGLISSQQEDRAEYESVKWFGERYELGQGAIFTSDKLPSYVRFLEQRVIAKDSFVHLMVCETHDDLVALRNRLPKNSCSISLFEKVKVKQTDAALEMLANWHPLLPPPIMLITVKTLTTILPKIIKLGILFNTLLLHLMSESMRCNAVSCIEQLLPRSKCFLFITQGYDKLNTIDSNTNYSRYIYPRQMLAYKANLVLSQEPLVSTMLTSDTSMNDSRHADDVVETPEQPVGPSKRINKIKIKMASAEDQSESEVVCTIDLTKKNEASSKWKIDDEIDLITQKDSSVEYYAQKSRGTKPSHKAGASRTFKQAYMRSRRILVDKGIWYNMSTDERLKLRDKVKLRIGKSEETLNQCHDAPTYPQQRYRQDENEHAKFVKKRMEQKKYTREMKGKGPAYSESVRCETVAPVITPKRTVEKVQRVFVKQTKKQKRLLNQLFDTFDTVAIDDGEKHAFLEQCLDYSCHPSIPKMKHKETVESEISREVVERGSKFRFIDRLMTSVGCDSKMLIVCDIPTGLLLLRRLSTLNDCRFLELCTKLDLATLSDIVQTSRTQVLLTSLATWQQHGYSTFDVDYLIIMDSIIHPNVDLKLQHTKLIQLVTLSCVDNYVYDYMCINYDTLAKSLPQIIEYTKNETNRENQFPRVGLHDVLAFQHEFAFFDDDA